MRAFQSVGGRPVFIKRGRGALVYDADDNEYVDFIGSWGPLILGHASEEVLEPVRETLANGTTFGLSTEGEVELAERIIELVPPVEMVRLVCSGTEATMSALRLARAATGRDRVIKFQGCYHGHADYLLADAGSGVATLGIPGTPGVTDSTARETIVLPFNDVNRAREVIKEEGSSIAAVIVEPVAGNMGVIPPEPGFLEGLRESTESAGVLLVFDEVMTGFRIARGGAAERYSINPDLVAMGKVIGGGFPVGAYGGRRDLMEQMAPQGSVYQAGTLSGNPVAVAAGLATLERVGAPGFLEELEAVADGFFDAVREVLSNGGESQITVQNVSTMGTLFFHPGPVRNWDDAAAADTTRFSRYFRAMLEEGILLPPSPFEAFFLSSAHGEEERSRFLQALPRALSI